MIFKNLLEDEDCCVELYVYYQDDKGDDWQMAALDDDVKNLEEYNK